MIKYFLVFSLLLLYSCGEPDQPNPCVGDKLAGVTNANCFPSQNQSKATQNTLPVAQSDTIETNSPTPSLNVFLNASDADNDVLTYTILQGPVNGTLSGTAPNLIYTPNNPNFIGSDSFTFKVNDGLGDSNIATINIIYKDTNGNNLPVSFNDNIVTNKNTPVSLILNANDPDSDPLTYTITQNPFNGTLSGTAPNLVYTPNPGFVGNDVFSFKVNDGIGDSNIASVFVEVKNQNVNLSPIAQNDSYTLNKNSSVVFTLNASDPENDALSYSITQNPVNGTLSGTAPNLVYTPNPGFVGNDTLKFKVNDGSSDSNVATISFKVQQGNQQPVSQSNSYILTKNTNTSFTLSASDADNDPLTYTIIQSPVNGTLSGIAPNLIYTPNNNFIGNDSMQFKVNDGQVDSNIATINFTVNDNLNQAPLANNANFSLEKNTNLNILLEANDADNDPLTYTIIQNPVNGTLNGSGANRVYTPNQNFVGNDSFQFKVNDGSQDSNVATINLVVNENPNQAPVAQGNNLNLNKNTSLNFNLIASDPESDPLTYTIVQNTLNGSVTGTPPNLVYTPNNNFVGSDVLKFKVNDGNQDSNVASIFFNIISQNEAPVANSSNFNTSKNVPVSLTLQASDVENDPLTYTITQNPSNGTLSGTIPNLIYTPNNNFVGGDSFQFKVNDGTQDSNIATINIQVENSNIPPVAQDDVYNVNKNTNLNFTLNASDADNEPLTYTISQQPLNGTLSGTAPNLIYTPNNNFVGNDFVFFEVSDSYATDSGFILINVEDTNINQAPVALSSSFTTNVNTSLNVLLTASDADNDPLTYTVVQNPVNGTLSGTAPNLIYTPNNNFVGNDSFQFKVNDGNQDSNIANITVSVQGNNNQAPLVQNLTITTDKNQAKPIVLLASDADNDPLTYSVVQAPVNGTLSGTAPNLVYTPNNNFVGSDSFTYKANDGTQDSNVASVSISVNEVNNNQAPTAFDANYTLNQGQSLSFTLNASDPENDTLTYIVNQGPLNGNLSGTFPNVVYTPNPGFFGNDSIQFKVNDGTQDSNVATINLSVLSIQSNTAPIALNAFYNVNNSVSFTLQANDAENDPLTYSIIQPPLNGTISGVAPNLTYTPNSNYVGADYIQFKVNDGQFDSNNATVIFNVTNNNEAPLSLSGIYTINKNQSQAITLVSSDVEGDPLSFSIVQNPSNGVLSGTPPNVTYIANNNFVGNDFFSFKTNDGFQDSNIAIINIQVVDNTNQSPIAFNQNLVIEQGDSLNLNLNAFDPENDSLMYTVVQTPFNGTLSGTAPNLVYSPNANFFGTDIISFKANDGSSDSNVALINITVLEKSGNLAPIAQGNSYNLNLNQTLSDTLIASDPENDILTYYLVSLPTKGTITFNSSTGDFSYTATNAGTDSFSFQVSDGVSVSNVAQVSFVNQGLQNQAPLAQNQNLITAEDQALAFILQASDPENDVLSYSIVSNPNNGNLLGTAPNLVYVPNQNFYGNDSFTFKVNDGNSDSNIAIVNIEVQAINDAPVANGAFYNLSNNPLNIVLQASDIEDTLSQLNWAVINAPSKGTLSGTAPNLVYTPNTNATGSDSFTFKVTDTGGLDSNIATINLLIGQGNQAPIAQNLSFTVFENQTLNQDLIAFDFENDALTYSIVQNPSASLNLSGNNFTYTPSTLGNDSFTYKVNDGNSDSNIATVNIEVLSSNIPPQAYSQQVLTDPLTPIPITLNGFDLNGDILNYTIESNPNLGIISGTPPNLVYTPLGQEGLDGFTFTVNDGQFSSNVAFVSIVLSNDDNNAPVANNYVFNIAVGSLLSESVVASDADNDPLLYFQQSPLMNLNFNNNGTFTYSNNTPGTYAFTYKANDNKEDSNVAQVVIVVGEANKAPTAFNQTVTIPKGFEFSSQLNASDPENDILSFVIDTPVLGSFLNISPDGSFSYLSNNVGSEVLTFKANDGEFDSNTATLTINVIDDNNPINTPPVSFSNSYTTVKNNPISIILNAFDPNGDSFSYSISSPSNGNLSGTAPNLIYTPNNNYVGNDSFTFKVNDGEFDSNVAVISIQVLETSINTAPTAQGNTYTLAQSTLSDTLIASDPENDSLSYSLVSTGLGTVSISGNTFNYQAPPNFTGTDSFTFKVNDGEFDSNVANIVINAYDFNNIIPYAECIELGQNTFRAFFGYENLGATVTIPVGSFNQFDPLPSDRGQNTLFTVGRHVKVFSVGSIPLNETLTWTLGTQSVSLNTASPKCNGGSNLAPIAQAAYYEINEDESFNFILEGSDPENDPLLFSLLSSTTNGSLSGTAPNLTYTPNANYNGFDVFSFKVSDGTLDSLQAEVVFKIIPVNDPPLTQDASYSLAKNKFVRFTLDAFDVDGDNLSETITTSVSNGTLLNLGNLEYIYFPEENFVGTDFLEFKVNDGVVESNISRVDFNIFEHNCEDCYRAEEYTGNGGHAMYLPGYGVDFYFEPSGKMFIFSDGTARLLGRLVHKDDAQKVFYLDMALMGRTSQPNSFGIKTGGGTNDGSWIFYNQFSAILTGSDTYAGTVLKLTHKGPSFQMGSGANDKTSSFGASSWFDYVKIAGVGQSSGHGDFNLDLFQGCDDNPEEEFVPILKDDFERSCRDSDDDSDDDDDGDGDDDSDDDDDDDSDGDDDGDSDDDKKKKYKGRKYSSSYSTKSYNQCYIKNEGELVLSSRGLNLSYFKGTKCEASCCEDDFDVWRVFVRENISSNSLFEGNSYNKTGVKLLKQISFQGERVAHFYGHKDMQSHEIQLVAGPFDLSNKSQIKVKFDYLLYKLKDMGDNDYLKLEICKDICQSSNSTWMDSSKWETLFQNDNSVNDKNLSDWSQFSDIFNLDSYDKTQITLRFVVRIQEGFEDNDQSKEIYDAAFLDNVEFLTR